MSDLTREKNAGAENPQEELKETELSKVTGGAVMKPDDEEWERLAQEKFGTDKYYIGKPCPRCEAESRGRYSIYCSKITYNSKIGSFWCFNCDLLSGPESYPNLFSD